MIENKSICPGRTMTDENGNRIQAHGAGMIYDNGTYYWYGENKEYTTGKTDVWTWGIRFYSSKDLVNWKDEGLVIPPDTENKESSLHPSKHVDRPHILYNRKTGKYICWLKLSEEEGYFVILSSQNLLGPYRIEKDHYRPFGMSAGDFDLWQDEEGNGFLYFEHDHAGVVSTRLTEDFLEVQGEYLDMFTELNPPYTREACTHFVYNGKHYLLTSGMIGYIPNPSEIAVSDSPLGPYTVIGDPHVDDESSASFNSQISCVFHDPARKELYLVMADRWVPEYVMTKKRYEQLERVIASQSDPDIHPLEEDYKTAMDAPFLGNANTSIAEYVWLPLNFKGEYPVIEWKDEWKIEDYEMYQIKNIQCEHRNRPLAVTVQKPRFSWEWDTEESNVFQSAYQILVQKEDGTIVWDSAKTAGRETADIEYAGEPLESKSRYLYQITAWDQDGREVKSGQEYFETAFLNGEDWRAGWIEPDPLPQLEKNPLEEAEKTWMEVLGAMMRGENPKMISDEENLRAQPLAPYDPPVRMRRVFRVEKEVRRARLYITAHGIYEAKINGKPVTDSALNPGFTTYDKRLKYQVFPAEALLRQGENAIAVTVADGWYKGKIALGRGCEYGEVPGLLLQLEMEYEDGTKNVLCSDERWRYSFDGPVRTADLFLGQTVDARRDDGDPSLRTYDAQKWKGVRRIQEADPDMDAQCSPLAKVFAEVPAQRVWTAPNGDTLVDFGQNMAGVIRVWIHGQTGEKITFEHGETLDQNGNFTYAFEGDETRAQKDCYICAGTGQEMFSPQFTYHGFRYVRVRGGQNWTKEQFTALAVSTENPVTGSFACSDERLNQLQHNIYWSQRSNNITIPTDCPTREKAGWTGDVVVYGATALYNQDMTAFYEDWLKSIRLEQTENGHVLNTVPLIKNYIQQNEAGSLGWGDVILTLPLQMYHLRGDIRVLEENYPAMERWMEAMKKSAHELPTADPMGAVTEEQFASMTKRQQDNQHYLINTGFHFGDWLVPSVKNAEGFSDGPASAFLTMNYVDTALLAADADMFAEVSELLGYQEKTEESRAYAGRVREAFYEEYVEEGGKIRQEMQGNYILALKCRMVPEEMKPALAEKLNELIRQNDYRLDTGFMSVPYLLDVLCDYGYEETAWKILWQTKCPSWLYEIEHGATTMWENWDAIREDGTVDKCSFNHYAFGCVGDFMYRRIAGIQNAGNGYDKIRIAPLYGCGLAWAEGEHRSPNGPIRVRWEKKRAEEGQTEKICISGRIPANTEAVLVLPDGSEQALGNGSFCVEV